MKHKLFLTSLAILTSISFSTEVAAANIHTVKSGDTLYALSRTYNVSVNDLKTLNKLSTTNIFVGQKLIISNSNATVSSSVKPTVSTNETTNYKIVSASTLNVRAGAGTSYKVIGTLSKNSKVTVISASNGWSKIEFKNSYGFVSSSYLSDVVSSNSVSNTKQSSNNTTTTINTNNQTISNSNTSTNSTSPEVSYIVKNGDTLYRIASNYSISVDVLKATNKLSSNAIYAGQKLIIKEGTKSINSTNSTNSTNSYLANYNIFIQPTEGVLTSPFGYRTHPITQQYSLHTGVDIAKSGLVDVVAAADGVVIRSGVTSGYGQYIVVSHIINEKSYATLYAHVRENSRSVAVGDTVKKGQKIALMGATGNVTGQHLHFEIHEGSYQATNTKVVDPLTYIKLK